MRGRVAVVLLLSLLLAIPVLAQCTLTPQYSGQYRTAVLDVAVDGNDLWTATSYGVQLLDRRTDPPSPIASVAVPGITRVVRATNGTAYSGSGSRIAIVRRNGNALELVRTIDAGANVNDLVLTTLYLYAATSNGIAQFDLLDPLNPTRTPVTFATSSPNVTSLALAGSTLYAADGDLSLEIFSISVPALPQRTGSIDALPRSVTVKTGGSRLYVSDGLQTAVIIGSTRAATLPFGGTSIASTATDVVFTAGSDRRLHAFDLAVAGRPVELFATDLVPNGGTINRFSQLVLSGNRLYGAGGDTGLLALNVSGFNAPFPVRAYPTGSATSVVIVDNRAAVSRAAGGFTDLTLGSTGNLTLGRQWDTRGSIVRDSGNGFLLTSSGGTLTFWTMQSTTPTEVSSASFGKEIVAPALVQTTAFVVLADNTFWTANLALTPAPTQQITTVGNPSLLARSGSSLVLGERRTDGSTILSFYASPGFAAPTRSVTLTGEAATTLALSGTLGAVFTFRGVTLVDFTTGTATVLPGSSSVLAKGLAFSGSRLLEVTEHSLLIWDTTSKTLARTLPLPSDPVAIAANDSLAVLATVDGVTSVSLNTASALPAQISAPVGNAYYRKVVAGGDRLYLFDGRGVDAFNASFGNAPHFVATIRPPSTIDVAASPSRVFTLGNGSVVSAWSPDGALITQTTLNEGTDVQPLSIAVVKDAVWVSIAKGCLTAACEKKTIVLDASSLVRTATLTGATTDVFVSANRAYTLSDLPAEIRIVDITDSLHPTVIASRAPEGAQSPVSIAFASGSILTLGEKLYVYNESLTKTAEQYAAYVADPTSGLAYVDQRLRVTGNCVLVTGRTFFPELLALPSLSTTQTFPMPAAAKSAAIAGGRIWVLTDYSLEALGSGAAPAVPRRPAAR